MSYLRTHLDGIGEVLIDGTVLPADPDVGINKPYIDDLYIYKDGALLDDAAYYTITPEQFHKLEQELLKHIMEQGALARASQRGQLDEY